MVVGASANIRIGNIFKPAKFVHSQTAADNG
jgi:hypothetical protein